MLNAPIVQGVTRRTTRDALVGSVFVQDVYGKFRYCPIFVQEAFGIFRLRNMSSIAKGFPVRGG